MLVLLVHLGDSSKFLDERRFFARAQVVLPSLLRCLAVVPFLRWRRVRCLEWVRLGVFLVLVLIVCEAIVSFLSIFDLVNGLDIKYFDILAAIFLKNADVILFCEVLACHLQLRILLRALWIDSESEHAYQTLCQLRSLPHLFELLLQEGRLCLDR